MRRRPGSRAIAALALSVQLTVAILGTVGLCLEREHTHGGVPAPECLMHHEERRQGVPGDREERGQGVPVDHAAPAGAAAEPAHHHHHHQSPETTPSPGTASIGCSCAGDALLWLLASTAILVEPSWLATASVAEADVPPLTEPIVDLHAAPLSPPPRASLS